MQSSHEIQNSNDLDIQRRRSNISRAESLGNSRRQYKKKGNLNSMKHQNTILSSYLPLKNFMGKDMQNIKPVRQKQGESKGIPKSSISDRQGLRTAKHGQRYNSKETFDDFVSRMKKQKTNENSYGSKPRPYTSNGYGQLRIKNHKRPKTKSGIGIQNYDQVRNYPYSHNRESAPSQLKTKQKNRIIGYKASPSLLNETDSKLVDHRKTFYPTSSDSIVNKTTFSNDAANGYRLNQIQNTYGHRGKFCT